MNKIACIFFEGSDSKVTIFEQENNTLKLLKAESIDTSLAFSDQKNLATAKSSGGDGKKDAIQYNFVTDESTTFSRTFLQKLNEFFLGEDVSKLKFIPILSEPAVYFQKINDEKDLASLNINAKGKIETTIDYVDLYDNTKLAIYSSGQSNYLQAIDSLAKMNNRRFFKIPAVKSAEISLASYVARVRNFNETETSLILYVGKEYSKLIFLKGNKILHIGSTLSVGRNSFNAHNVIVSKILLEMEHGSLSNIDNIVVCGEDDSEDLLSIMREAYPKTQVLPQKLKSVEIISVDSFSNEASFIIPIAVAEEYFAELNKKYAGINLLPNYIKEEQTLIHLDWKGYLTILLIIISTIFFGVRIQYNNRELAAKNEEIRRIRLIQAQNKEITAKIQSYENKIRNVDQTKAVLDQLSSGTEVISNQMKKLAEFTDEKKNLWISQVKMDVNKNMKINGYTFVRPVVKELSDSYKGSILQNIIYDPLRDFRSFKFEIDAGNLVGGVRNEKKK